MKNLDKKKLPPRIQTFLADTKKHLASHGITLKLNKVQYIQFNGMKLGGYFCETDKEIKVAAGCPLENWVSLLAHESSHADQFIEKSPSNRRMEEYGLDPNIMLDEWMLGHLDMDDNDVEYVVKLVQENELDCEKRAVRKIRQYNLPIDDKVYIQMSNSYLYFYYMVFKHRCWYEKSPYLVPELVSLMPTKFLAFNKYWNIPPNLVKLYNKYVFLK